MIVSLERTMNHENPEGECLDFSLCTYAAIQQSKTQGIKIRVLEKSPSQSLDLNPIKMLWQDLKQAVQAWKPINVAE